MVGDKKTFDINLGEERVTVDKERLYQELKVNELGQKLVAHLVNEKTLPDTALLNEFLAEFTKAF